GHPARDAPHAVVGHAPQGVGEVGVPVAVAPVDRQVDAVRGEVLLDRGDQCAVLVVDRAPATEAVVVLPDLLEAFDRDVLADGDVLQERHHVLGLLGSAEGHQQQRVVGRPGSGSHAAIVGRSDQRPDGARHPRGAVRCAAMLASYRAVLSRPGALPFSLAGLIGRLPISMISLGLVLLVEDATGSYGSAGVVSAAYVLGNATLAILSGRLIDRFG